MKTIDDVIFEARESAKYHRNKKNNLLRTEDNLQQHLTIAEESDQLADWLEEYKAYKEIGTVQGYKDAIDAYTEEYNLRKNVTNSYADEHILRETLELELKKHRENNQKILEYIHSGNRGSCDYFIVDQIEELLEG